MFESVQESDQLRQRRGRPHRGRQTPVGGVQGRGSDQDHQEPGNVDGGPAVQEEDGGQPRDPAGAV